MRLYTENNVYTRKNDTSIQNEKCDNYFSCSFLSARLIILMSQIKVVLSILIMQLVLFPNVKVLLIT